MTDICDLGTASPTQRTQRTQRTRRDRCPGVLRPWKADDGLLLRIRLVGGHVSADALRTLGRIATAHGNGRILVTTRANLQLRALPDDGTGHVPSEILDEIRAVGLLDHPEHDLVRNIMVSPATGLAGGRADLRALATELDRLVVASPTLATLPGKFLFVLDDRGDLRSHECDLGVIALDAETVQLRLDDHFGEVIPLAEAAVTLAAMAEQFVVARGTGADAPWHLREMPTFPFPTQEADPRVGEPVEPLPFGPTEAGNHVEIGRDGLPVERLDEVLGAAPEVIITGWYGLLVPAQP